MKTYAGFWQRVGAFALDYLLILGYLIFITLLFLFLNANQWLFAERIQAQLIASSLITLPVTLYFAIFEASARQATWGKQRLGLKVADRKGYRVSVWRALSRTLLKFVPWELSHTLIWQISFAKGADPVWISYGFALVYLLIGLNVASLLLTRTHQTLYDLLTATYVIPTR